MRAITVFFLSICASIHVQGQTFSEDSLASAGLTGIRFGAGVWGDYDIDGDPDLVIIGMDSSGANISRLFQNSGSGAFVEVSTNLEMVQNGDLAWGDLDNDNDLDLLLTGEDSLASPVTKIYRNDNGVLVESGIQLPGLRNSSVTWGDYNQDGKLDFLLTGQNTSGQPVTGIYRNDGNGLFTNVNSNLPGIHLGAAVWGDLDGDNLPDIVLTGEDVSGIPVTKIYQNQGNDVFSEMSTTIIGLTESAVALGDYNNDGDLDLVICGLDVDSVLVSRLYRNNGTGTFFLTTASLTGLRSVSVNWADADNDGDPDILLTGLGADTLARSLVYINAGQSVFTLLQPGLPGVSDGAGNWADFDDDGDLDILLAGEDSSGLAITKIYKNETTTPNTLPTAPDGLSFTFTTTTMDLAWNRAGDAETDTLGLTYNVRVGTTPGGFDLWSAMAADDGRRYLNNRGNVGISTSLSIPINTVKTSPGIYWSVQAVDQNLAGSTFAPEQSFLLTFPEDTLASNNLPGVNASSLNWGDYDGDGDLDLLISGQDVLNNRITKIFRNDGNSLFVESGIQLDGVAAGASTWGDYNNDGLLDILLTGVTGANRKIATVYRNLGNSAFVNIGAGLPGVQSSAVDWGDFDNDGDLDILLAGFTATGIISQIYRNDNSVFVDIQAGLTGIQTGSASWADFDNDGYLDVLLAGSSSVGSITKIYRNNKNETFTDFPVTVPGIASGAVSLGDFEGDGDVDILLCGSTVSGRITAIYKNDGSAVFVDANAGLPGISNGDISWFDYDSDGDLDIVLAGFDNSFARKSAVFRNDSDTLFTDIQTLLQGVIFGSVVVADYDGDNNEDIVLTGSSVNSRVTQVYRNQSPNSNTKPEAPEISTASFNQNALTFNWLRAIDNEEPQAGLTYNLRVGTKPGGNDIVPSMSLAGGFRQVKKPGNAGLATSKSISIQNILDYPGVYWSVQAVDNQASGSPFSEEGSFAAQIISVTDVPNDEGGKVTIKWKASSLDHDVNRLTSYSVWRAIPEPSAPGARGAVTTATGSNLWRIQSLGKKMLAWEWLANLPAHRRPLYSYTSITHYDSTSNNNGIHYFIVAAHTENANIFFDSQPDSGFSIDNLPPIAPANLTAEHSGENILLNWEASKSADLKQYDIYQNTSAGIDIENIEPFASTSDTALLTGALDRNINIFFVVVARDSSGNLSIKSNEAALLATQVKEDKSAAPKSFSLQQNYPNPFNPTTEIRFTIPLESDVKIEIFNVRGRLVTTLINRKMNPGYYNFKWEINKLASGTYIYRIQAGSFVAARKMVFLR